MNSNSHVTESTTLSAQNLAARGGGVNSSNSSLHLEHVQRFSAIDNSPPFRGSP